MKKSNMKVRAMAVIMAMLMVMSLMNFAMAASVEDYIAGEAKWTEVSDADIANYLSGAKKDWDWQNSMPKSTISEVNGGTADPVDANNSFPCNGNYVQITSDGVKQLRNLIKQEADAQKAKEAIGGIGDGLGFQPDITGATEMMQGFMKPLSLVVGVITVIAMVAITAFTASDIMYMTIPLMREKSDAAAQSGNNMMGKQSNAGGGMRPRWVTDEAYVAVQEATTSGKNMFGIYIKKRGAAMIFQALAIYILLTGNITLISNLLINIIGGIMAALSGLAT